MCICVVDRYLSFVTFLNRFVYISANIYLLVQLNLTVSLTGTFAIITDLYCFLSEFLFWFICLFFLGPPRFGCKILWVFLSLTCQLWVVFTHWPAGNLFRAIRKCLRNSRGHQGRAYIQNSPENSQFVVKLSGQVDAVKLEY